MRGYQLLVYSGKKILVFVCSIFFLSVFVFYISRLAPGDPLVSYYGERVEKMSSVQREQAQEKLGLNDPVSVQYVRWLERAMHGDFGISYKYKMDVVEVVSGRIGNTLLLGGTGFLLIFLSALLLGTFCAWREDRLADRILCRAGTITGCIPEFWLALLLILVFSVRLKWLPGSGAYTIGRKQDPADRMLHLILPLTVVVLSHLWYYAYMVRNQMLEEIRADYVLFAKAKGLGNHRILFRHCLRNVLPAYLSLMAVSVPHIMGGTYIVELVFSYPGIGMLSYESARYKDYHLLMLLSMLSGTVVIVCSMVAQMINTAIDPRMGLRNRPHGRPDSRKWETDMDHRREMGNGYGS